MTKENLTLWDELGSTDPKYTKKFKRSGGFSGTSVNPTWQLKLMTERFGPCGIGWYYEVTGTQTHEGAEGHILVYRDINLFIKAEDEWSKPIHGTGGDCVIGKNKHGLAADDEAYKKAETDALGNAMKKLGMGADVHMGMFDDSKYVNDMKAKFGENEDTRPPMTGDQFLALQKEINDCKTLGFLKDDVWPKVMNEFTKFKPTDQQKDALGKAKDKKKTELEAVDLANKPLEAA